MIISGNRGLHINRKRLLSTWIVVFFFIALVLFQFTGNITGSNSARAEGEPLAFGVLPVIQALPLFVAQEMGIFYSEGVEVELVPFRTAMEKEIAMTSGRLDGYFGDLFTPIMLRSNDVQVRIVGRNFITGRDQRMFAVLAAPGSDIKLPVQLADVPVAVSTNTIIEYVTIRLLTDGGLPPDRIRMLEAKNIPLRFQMLVSGQLKAATLPEPLVTLAEKQGARVLADDAQSDLSSTVLVFTNRAINNRAGAIANFMAALDQAVEVINSGNHGVRDIMNRNCNVPKPLWGTYPVPHFPGLALPDRKRVDSAISWLSGRGALRNKPDYSSLVDGQFLK